MKRIHHPRAREVDVYALLAERTLIAILLVAAFLLFDALTSSAQVSPTHGKPRPAAQGGDSSSEAADAASSPTGQLSGRTEQRALINTTSPRTSEASAAISGAGSQRPRAQRSSTGPHPHSGSGNSSEVDEGALREARKAALAPNDIGAPLPRRKTVGGQVRTDGQGSAPPRAASDRQLAGERWKSVLKARRAGAAAGQASNTRSTKHQLALELAVVAAHEGALDNVEETSLVWQVLESRARTTSGRLALLRSHSPRALGRKPCKGGNCQWSVELLHAPDKTPASVNAGYWQRVRADQWDLVRRRALGLVFGVDAERPCAAAPYSWGYAGDVESAYRERGLVPLGCGTMNDGFAFAPRVISAREAAGQ